MESSIEQTSHRVKAAEKQWPLPNAEAMLALSEDGRWGDRLDAAKDGSVVISRRRKGAISEAPAPRALAPTAAITTIDGEEAAR